MTERRAYYIHLTGTVQGVGFRPFVYGLATRLGLTGWVRNTSAGVEIEVDGIREALQAFVTALRTEAPPLAHIDRFSVESRLPNGFTSFEIVHSEPIAGAFQPVSPDVSICPDCLRELFDPGDRRFRYPFINCTNCGPRFTIIRDIPYDRPNTTMASFELCPECAAEYAHTADRRFHAQPVACPVCGPQVWLEVVDQRSATGDQRTGGLLPQSPVASCQSLIPSPTGDRAILEAQRLLSEGRILAVKGLGGFHLACDAVNSQAVAELRRRKLRVDKPFALMMPDLETVSEHCFVDEAERQLLESRQRPVVILRRRPASAIAREVAPGQDTLGVMLPYTPLHYLLLDERRRTNVDDHRSASVLRRSSFVFRPSSILVMTSGNLSEEPIATDNEEARQRLASLADAFLMHGRPIHLRCDDSVVRICDSTGGGSRTTDEATESSPLHPSSFILHPSPLYLRRSRGYAPSPVLLPCEAPPLLAAGAELKNVFCITHGRYAFLSQHIGDLENYETLQSFESGVEHFERLFRVKPQALAYDLHPDYLATRYALERAQREGLPAVGVQHHHAHIAACMAEHGLDGDHPLIGVSFDGTGFGEDDAIWGGEFLIAGYGSYQRAAHLAYVPLPGGEAAIRKPARIALAYLWQAGLEWLPGLPSVDAFCAQERAALRLQLERSLNAPLSSSVGRLFDAAAAISGVRQKVNYEAQAAIEFEALADPQEDGAYTFDLSPAHAPRPSPGVSPYVLDPLPVIRAIYLDVAAGLPLPAISARFHNGLAQAVLDICRLLRRDTGLERVALSGGVWQNLTLLRKTVAGLQKEQFDVYIHRQVPPNDGGLALGQAAIAAHRLAG